MPSAELITIGTELLLGEIQDTNTRFLAKKFKENNIDLFRITMIGDNASRIACLINESLSRSEIVITTGGLGPTIDDPTREAIALAFNTTNEFHPELWQEIDQRFRRRSIIPTENNQRQAYIPKGAQIIHNPVGTAPCFYLEVEGKIVICLPGVPKEMEYLTETSVLPFLHNKFNLEGIIKPRILHLAAIGESVVDNSIGEYEKLSNPTVGLLAHPGMVDIRITAKANSEFEADKMIDKIEREILELFPGKIFGYDDQTLLSTVNALAAEKKLKINLQTYGLNETISSSEKYSNIFVSNLEKPQIQLNNQLLQKEFNCLEVYCQYQLINNESRIDFNICSNDGFSVYTNMYNGPSAQGSEWAKNVLFETIRQTLLKN
jgi:nicotinamide-nucleotide amidase